MAKSRLLRLVIVLAGVVAGQVVLYGPSLVEERILLPLDILSQDGVYLSGEAAGRVRVHDNTLSDLVCIGEPARRFAAAELRAGRLPSWLPAQFAGAPFIWPKFSPFMLLGCCTASPVILAWVQMSVALVAGLGAFVFFRHVLGVGFWPAALASWCYPLTGFFVLWQGYGTAMPVAWLPWLLFAVDRAVGKPGGSPLAPLGLALITTLVLVSGQLDVAGQVLLVSGLYGLWCLARSFGKAWFAQPTLRAALRLGFAWGLGFLLAAPAILPALEYSRVGARMERRAKGAEERPPIGLPALPQLVMPLMYGTTEHDSFPDFPAGVANLQESAAAAYTGIFPMLLFAPLAFCGRRHRRRNWLWLGLFLFGLSWDLNVPGMVQLLRLPVLNMMSHNRLVFATSFAVLALAAEGLEALWQSDFAWRKWLWAMPALLALLAIFSAYQAVFLPEALDAKIQSALAHGGISSMPWLKEPGAGHAAGEWFVRAYLNSLVCCGLALLAWLYLRARSSPPPLLVASLAVLAAADLLWFGAGQSVQCERSLYYPRLTVLDQLSTSGPGRFVGYGCLQPNLGYMCGLRDVRGYDAVDPARYVELLARARDPGGLVLPYSSAQHFIPDVRVTPQGDITAPPILDMLGLRWVVFRGPLIPNSRPVLRGDGYFVLVNPNALPRAYVPGRVELETDRAARLDKLASRAFAPREVAYVEVPVDLPAECRGAAEVVDEVPARVNVSLRMETAGLVVLADLWDEGWKAFLDAKPAPILRANHALRGVVAPPGSHRLEFRYEPASLTWGLRLSVLAGVSLLAWFAATWRSRC